MLAKVTRDRIMAGLHEHYPAYDFLGHKGYVTPVHSAALDAHGPCPEHRFSYVNVARRVPDDQRVPARTLLRMAEAERDEIELDRIALDDSAAVAAVEEVLTG